MTHQLDWTAPGGGRAVLLGSAFGLASEEAEAVAAFSDDAYDMLLLGIGREALEQIVKADGEPQTIESQDLGPVAELHLRHLSRFGPTHVPALELYSLWRLAKAKRVAIQAIDLDDAAHTESYVRHVKIWETLRKEQRQLKRAAALSEEDSLADLVRKWDHVFFPTKGLRAVEADREAAMAAAVAKAAEGGRRVFAVVPWERLRGIQAILESSDA